MKRNITREREREQLPPSNLEEYKKTKINELQDRLNDEIIIKNNFQALKGIIENCRDKEQVDLVFSWGSENYQTGYYFNRKVENFRESARYLKKVGQINKGGENKLIIGDNYDALNNLLITHKNKIDIIYIDPPYGMDDENTFAKENYDNKIDRDGLLSMLEPRLELAKRLLSDEGTIFCSIDDRNQAYVKLLFDRVFGEVNFIACIPRITTTSGKNDEKRIGKAHDYLLVYSFLCIFNKNANFDQKHYRNDDNDPRGFYQTNVVLDSTTLPYVKSLDFEIFFKGKKYLPGEKTNQIGKVCWRWNKEKVKFGIDNNLIVEKNGRLYTKGYLEYEIKKINGEYNFVKKEIGKTSKTLDLAQTELINESYGNRVATMELNSLGILFSNPKPTNLIKKIVSFIPHNKEDLIVCDFFAGSGTTGQAILELNKEDKGKRKFILCVNDSGNSDEICKERLKRVMTGKDSSGKSNFDWVKKHKPLGSSLNIYEIKEASIHTDANCLLDLVDEDDYDLPKFKNKVKKIEWITENFKVTTKELK